MTEPDLSFQHYKVLRQTDGSWWELGRGSMGITYKAFDVNLCCEVALKVINAATLEHPHARERFVSEARAAAKLRHRNVASVHHLGNDGDHYFYAMEFVDGETLDCLVRRQGPLPVATVLRILLQAARALAAATRQGLVHRDLKPANIMVTHEDDDDEMLVKVIDFGLAKPIASPGGSRPLTFGGFVGTPQFASPEQLEERSVDGRSDIYSLGATAWFLLTGRAPFVGALATICRQHLTQPPPWSQLPKPFPETVRTLLGHMLEKDPLRRPTDAVELRRQIEASLEVIREPLTDIAPVPQKVVAKPPNWFRPRVQRPAGTVPPAEGEAPRTGMILKGRYELLRLVGEGNSGRVFQARDRGADEALVAIKVLHPELVATAAERDRLGAEVQLIQAAADPQLTRIAALETLISQETVFLVEEWLHGFTLLDFLAVRGGALPLGEGLRLLEQAATVADHAGNQGLERLDFTLHQFHLHFPAAKPGPGSPEDAREPMQTAMAQWPAWILKLNPLGALRKGLESSTWAGDVTLTPGGAANVSAGHSVSKPTTPVRDLYTRGIAQLTYELLGGAPASPVYDAAKRPKYVSLPALNEEANGVLQSALSEDVTFASGTEFYLAIARASGFHSANRAAVTRSQPSNKAIPAVAVGNRTFAKDEPADLSDAPTVTPDGDFDPNGNPVPAGNAAWGNGDDADAGGVWDRLALVSGEGASSRLWVGGVLICFVSLLVGSIVFLMALERHPARKTGPPAVAAKAAKKNKSEPAASPSRAPSTAPVNPAASAARPVVGTPLPRGQNGPVPSGSPGHVVGSDALAQSTAPKTPRIVPTVDSDATPPPLNPVPPDQPVRVHITSKPPGVEVLAKGKVLGLTPFDVNLPAGDYQLATRHKTWPEVRQTLHLSEGQQTAAAELHLLPPTLVPSATTAASPVSRTRRAQQEAVVRRNFVRSTRGGDAANAGATPGPVAGATATNTDGEVRRALPKLHPFDPNGRFRPTTPQDSNE